MMNNDNNLIGIILKPERYHQLLDAERDLIIMKSMATKSEPNAQQDVEKAINGVPQQPQNAPERPKFEYDNRPYEFMTESKIKVRGIFDKLFAHPKLAPFMSQVPKETLNELGSKWLPVTIYRALYENVDGDIWVRMKEEFDSKFKRVK